MATGEILKLVFVFMILRYNLHVMMAALVTNSTQQSFVSGSGGLEESKNQVETGRAVIAAAAEGRRGGGDNGNGGPAGAGVIPVYTAAGAANKKHHKNGHHKGGCIECKVIGLPLLPLFFVVTALFL